MNAASNADADRQNPDEQSAPVEPAASSVGLVSRERSETRWNEYGEARNGGGLAGEEAGGRVNTRQPPVAMP